MQLPLPLDMTLKSDRRDVEIVAAYLRYRSIRRTARELEIDREKVRAAINRVEWIFRRAADAEKPPTGSES